MLSGPPWTCTDLPPCGARANRAVHPLMTPRWLLTCLSTLIRHGGPLHNHCLLFCNPEEILTS